MGVNMDPKALRQIELAVRRVQRLASTPAPPTAHQHTASDVGAADEDHTHQGSHPHPYASDTHGHTAGEVGAAPSGHNHDGAYAPTHAHPYSTTDHTHPGGGGGAKAMVLPLVQHFTTLEVTSSANLLWKIPAATTYGQVAVPLDMTKLGSPTSAEFFVVYTNTATTGTNQIALALGSAPRAAGTTVTPIASSITLLANTATYPQTIRKALVVAELGSTAQWLQFALNVTTGTVGPNVFSLGLILYY